MAKSILISIKPRYIADILNHKKTIEVRKSMPKCDLPIDVYIYCTKKEYLMDTDKGYFSTNNGLMQLGYYRRIRNINGKVVAKFTLNKVNEIRKTQTDNWFIEIQKGIVNVVVGGLPKILEKSCLKEEELINYLKGNNGYAWHIDNLVIFDKPKELSEFYKIGHYEDLDDYFTDEKQINGKWCIPLKKAPKSFCYVEVEE